MASGLRSASPVVHGSKNLVASGTTIGGRSANGDGVDISGGKISVRDSIFSGLGDKGISIGEKSRIFLTGNIFKSNNNGIAVKDLSQAYLFQNKFEDNVTDINIYQKKKIFGGGRAFIYGIAPEETRSLKYKLDEQSKIYFLDSSDIPDSFSRRILPREEKSFILQLQDSLPSELLFDTVKTTLLPVIPAVRESGSNIHSK